MKKYFGVLPGDANDEEMDQCLPDYAHHSQKVEDLRQNQNVNSIKKGGTLIYEEENYVIGSEEIFYDGQHQKEK